MENELHEAQTANKTIKKWHIWVSWVATVLLVVLLVSILYWQPSLAKELAQKNGEQRTLSVDPIVEPSDEI
ncbi:MAG: hypothetical protein ACK2TV_00520, partial [Anaerolineales bacterium]